MGVKPTELWQIFLKHGAKVWHAVCVRRIIQLQERTISMLLVLSIS